MMGDESGHGSRRIVFFPNFAGSQLEETDPDPSKIKTLQEMGFAPERAKF